MSDAQVCRYCASIINFVVEDDDCYWCAIFDGGPDCPANGSHHPANPVEWDRILTDV